MAVPGLRGETQQTTGRGQDVVRSPQDTHRGSRWSAAACSPERSKKETTNMVFGSSRAPLKGDSSWLLFQRQKLLSLSSTLEAGDNQAGQK